MNYLQIGVLAVVGIILFIIWWVCFVDLNKDVTYQNRNLKDNKKKPKRRKMKGSAAQGSVAQGAYMPSIMGEGPQSIYPSERGGKRPSSGPGNRPSAGSKAPHLKVYPSQQPDRRPTSKRPPRER